MFPQAKIHLDISHHLRQELYQTNGQVALPWNISKTSVSGRQRGEVICLEKVCRISSLQGRAYDYTRRSPLVSRLEPRAELVRGADYRMWVYGAARAEHRNGWGRLCR